MNEFALWFFGTLVILGSLIIIVHLYTRRHEEVIQHYLEKHPIGNKWVVVPVILYILIIILIMATQNMQSVLAPLIVGIMVLSIIIALIKAVVDVTAAKKLIDSKSISSLKKKNKKK